MTQAATSGSGPARVTEQAVDDAVSFVRSRLERQLQTMGDTAASLALVHVPAPVASPEAALGVLGERDHAFVWAPAEGRVFSGAGAVRRIEPSGEHRLDELRRASDGVFASIRPLHHPSCTPPEPRLFGGLSFSPGSADTSAWQDYGDGCFTLPRLLYSRAGDDAVLSVAVDLSPTVDGAKSPSMSNASLNAAILAEEIGSILANLKRVEELQPYDASDLVAPLTRAEVSLADWTRQVETIRAGIGKGNFEKIVAARCTVLDLGRAIDPIRVLTRLAEQMPTCTRFGFLRQASVFLGATPERLVSRRGSTIYSQALAGSIAGGRRQAARLIESDKDRLEHSLVVAHVVETLQPLCSTLDWRDRPRVRELRNIFHLDTSIRGRLREDTHVLDLVKVLHPTPAVGGVPSREAVQWIERHEQPRGWYAGPIGWFNAEGDGEFSVALRSCLLSEARAYVYAGAGIVGDSDPRLEYQETELKQRTMRVALGATEALSNPALEELAPAR